ncbi:hypothetical protein BY996DRAFT_6426413 [Phakopsora pachyrhizi]|nr:hypothetical protein BY996DRAFT_6426413 [Phakopsora pachyrhizi]
MPNLDNPYTSPNSVNCTPRSPSQKGDCSGTSWNFYPQGQYAMAATQPPSTATQPAKGQYPNYSLNISYAYTPYTNYSQYNHNQQSHANQGSSFAFQQSSVHQQQTTQGSGHCYQPSNFLSPSTGHGHQGTQQEVQALQPSNFLAPHQQKLTQGYPCSQPSSLPLPSKSFSAVGNGPQGSQQEGQALQPSDFLAHHQHQATQEYPHSQQSNPPPPSKYFSATGHGPQGSQQEGQAFQPSKSNRDLPNRGSDNYSQPLSFPPPRISTRRPNFAALKFSGASSHSQPLSLPPPSNSFSATGHGHQSFQQAGNSQLKALMITLSLQAFCPPVSHSQQQGMTIGDLNKKHQSTQESECYFQTSTFPPPSHSNPAAIYEQQSSEQEGQAAHPSHFHVPHQYQRTKELVQHPRPSSSLLHRQPTLAGFSTSSNPKLVSINQLELPVKRETIPHTQVTSPTPPPPEKACSSAQNTCFLQVSSAKTIPAKTSGFEFSFQSAQAENHRLNNLSSIGDLQPVNPSQGTLPPNFSKSSHSQNSKTITNPLVEPSNDKCSGRTGSFFKPIPQISSNSSSENSQEFTLTNLQKDCDQTADSSKITSGANNIVDNINQNPYPASQCFTKNESFSLPSKVTLSTVQNMEDSLSLKAQDNISKNTIPLSTKAGDSLLSPPPKTKSQITTALIKELNEIEKASLVDASKK